MAARKPNAKPTRPAEPAASTEEVVFLNPFTCGIYKDGGSRYKTDPATGRRTSEIDNELGDQVSLYLGQGNPPGLVKVGVDEVFRKRVLVPRYYDERWLDDFRSLVARDALQEVTLGDLEDRGIIEVFGGHGSPSNDQRTGNIPYVKVSDIRSLRVNINPTNLVPRAVAEYHWGGTESGLQAWDLITPNRASSNIGEFAVMLPGEEQVVITKEVFIIRVPGGAEEGWGPFYLFWALCLKAVRKQWQRIALMQTNREDVADRYREVRIPVPRDPAWAKSVSTPFHDYFTTLAQARVKFKAALTTSGFEYIASAHNVNSAVIEAPDPLEADRDDPEDEAG